MRVQFVHRLRTVWSWLPAFRAVAETEHLPTAASELGIVASSLSRAVKLFEDEIGVALFDRAGKGLTLNAPGRVLLGAVRDAMRIIDDALGVALADELRGSVGALAASELANTLVVPATALLAARHPQLCASIAVATDETIPAMLLRGDGDVAITLQAPVHAELEVRELARWSRGVYARTAAAVEPRRAVLVGTPSAYVKDGWPTSHERTIAAWAHDEWAALELCARCDLVTVAFDVVARTLGHSRRLVRLDVPAIPSRTLYIVNRRAVGAHRRTNALIEAIREVTPASSG
jgi:DNA-binding transcriptional LysR family regulator